MNKERFFSEPSKREKSKRQEKAIAKFSGGRTTIASGAVFRDGDVEIGRYKFRVEAKTTDKSSMVITKDWMDKIAQQSRFEIPVMNIEIQDQNWYLIRPQEFALILEYLDAMEEAYVDVGQKEVSRVGKE